MSGISYPLDLVDLPTMWGIINPVLTLLLVPHSEMGQSRHKKRVLIFFLFWRCSEPICGPILVRTDRFPLQFNATIHTKRR